MFLARNIKDYISNKHIYCMRDICYKCESHKLERYTIKTNTLFCKMGIALPLPYGGLQ